MLIVFLCIYYVYYVFISMFMCLLRFYTYLHTCIHAASGWRIHCGVEATELSTNKQDTLSYIYCVFILMFIMFIVFLYISLYIANFFFIHYFFACLHR